MVDELIKSTFGTRMIPFCSICTDNAEQCDACCVILDLDSELFCLNGKYHFCSQGCYEDFKLKNLIKK